VTTKDSPIVKLRQQADKIAEALKAAERGEEIVIHSRRAGKVEAARARASVVFAVCMDDKIIKIEMSWATIRETSEAGLSEWIVNHMRELHPDVH
jgi:hypothetical protein